MPASSALARLKEGGESDQDQDNASPEQEEATVVLIGDGDIADERYGPPCPVDVVPLDRQRPRVTDVVGIALGVEQELPAGSFGDLDDAVHDLLGGLERVPEDDHVPDMKAVDRDTLADDDAADRQSRSHAAREDRGHHPGALDECEGGDSCRAEHGQHEDVGDDGADEPSPRLAGLERERPEVLGVPFSVPKKMSPAATGECRLQRPASPS